MDVVLAEAARRLRSGGFGVQGDVPDRRQREPVHVPDLGQGDQLDGWLGAGVEGMAVDPACGVRIALHLEVLGQLLAPDGPTLVEQLLYLAQHQGVSFDGRGVVSLVHPDLVPDRLRFDLGR